MGPGYLPLALGLVLALLGLATIAKAYLAPEPLPDVPGAAAPGQETPDSDTQDPRPLAGIQLRPTAAVFAAVTFFALTVDGLGLLSATFGTGLLAALGRPGTRAVRALVIAAGLTVASWIIFVVLLQLRLPLLGDWLGG